MMMMMVEKFSGEETRPHLIETSPPSGAGPDYGLGVVGKCREPMTSKSTTKDGCKNSEHMLANRSLMFYAP